MKQGDKNKIGAVEFEQFTNELAVMDRIAELMGDVDTMPKNFRVQKKPISVMPLYDLPVFYPCNDGQYRYPCSDGKWRTYDEIVKEAARAQQQGMPALPIYARQGQPPVTCSIIAKIRAAVANVTRYGQRKRERGKG